MLSLSPLNWIQSLKDSALEVIEVNMSTTEQFLKEAFAGESQANRKYLAFAQAMKILDFNLHF